MDIELNCNGKINITIKNEVKMKNLNKIKMKLKKPLKERQIEVLIEDIGKWNRYMAWCRRKDWYFKADLIYANLSGVYLNGADLNGANLDFSSLPLSCGSLKMKTDTNSENKSHTI